MEAKGTTVATLGKFVRTRYGDEAHRTWLEGLSPAARAIHSGAVMPSLWYPMAAGLIEPTERICRLHFDEDIRGAWECGRFSAEDGLRGVYRIFIAVGTPAFIIKKASNLWPQLYRPSSIRIASEGPKSVTFHVTEFPEAHRVIDARICGWMERALEISGCKGGNIQVPRSLARGDSLTEFIVGWS